MDARIPWQLLSKKYEEYFSQISDAIAPLPTSPQLIFLELTVTRPGTEAHPIGQTYRVNGGLAGEASDEVGMEHNTVQVDEEEFIAGLPEPTKTIMRVVLEKYADFSEALNPTTSRRRLHWEPTLGVTTASLSGGVGSPVYINRLTGITKCIHCPKCPNTKPKQRYVHILMGKVWCCTKKEC
ncbi:MAG: hypothetical protein K8L91_04115 [Anaerolineae bacterium]|nr:hypothetical protein [Anaerolineae bacterium]